MNKPEKIKTSEIIIFKTEDEKISVDVRFEDETVWLTQDQIATLFGKGRSTITEHIGNIFAERELQEEVVCRKFRHTTQHGAIAGKTQAKFVSSAMTQFEAKDIRNLKFQNGISSWGGTRELQYAELVTICDQFPNSLKHNYNVINEGCNEYND